MHSALPWVPEAQAFRRRRRRRQESICLAMVNGDLSFFSLCLSSLQYYQVCFYRERENPKECFTTS